MKTIMPNSIKHISLVGGLLLLLGLNLSCSDDFFDVPVGQRVTPGQHYQNLEDAMVSMNGALIGLQDVAPSLILLDGLRSDQMDITPNADGNISALYRQQFHADNPYLDHTHLYKVIINVNEVLSHIDRAAALDRDFKDHMLFDMRANLYGLRAWCYLNIARLYGKAVMLPETYEKLPGNLSEMVPLPKETVIDSLIHQFLNDSVIYDQDTATIARDQSYFFKYPNYKAVLGELFLEQGDFKNAIYYLKLGLESAPVQAGDAAYKVDAFYAEDTWKTIFFNAENALLENIMVIPYSINQKQVNTMVELMLPSARYMVRPAMPLVHLMESQITTRNDSSDVYRGMGLTYDTLQAGTYYIKKYAMDEGQPYSSDIVLQRAGELHLLLAEALNRDGQPDVALMFLNNGISGVSASQRPSGYSKFSRNRGIRNRVLLRNIEIPDSIEGQERVELVEDYILREKAMECAFEGKRMSDLIRIAERRANPGEFIGSIIASKYTEEMAVQIKQFYAVESNWYLPFP